MSLDLDTIRRRADAATRGPWRLVTDSCDCDYGCPHGTFPYALHLPIHAGSYGETPCDPDAPSDHWKHKASEIGDLTMESAEFIAHSRADVPALLAEIDRLRAALDTMTQVARSNKRHYAEVVVMLDRFNDLVHDTDGGELDDGENVPAGEIRRALHEPVRSNGTELPDSLVDQLVPDPAGRS